jgi:hypothetical protein
MLCEFAYANYMIMRSTQFQNKQIKANWISTDQTPINQTDHVLVNANNKEVIQDIRSMKGPNMDLGHFLQNLIIKQKLLTIYIEKNFTIQRI